MDCKVKAQDAEGKCVTGEQCSDIKCTSQETEHIPPAVGVVEKPDYGVIYYGLHQGKEWVKLPTEYLEYLISDKCKTAKANKDKAEMILKIRKAK